MAYPDKPQLSALEKAELVLRLFFLAPFAVPFNITRVCLLAAIKGLFPLPHFPTVGLYRTVLTLFPYRQTQVLLPTSISAYKAWMTKKQKQHPPTIASKIFTIDIESIPGASGPSLLWIGDRRTAKKFVLLIHGGGFYISLNTGHLEWGLQSYIRACSGGATSSFEDSDVAVAMLDYSLSPEAVYPTQLIEVSLALKHLLQQPRVTPGNLLIGGDSAGGTLTAQLLSHLVWPHPQAVRVELSESLAGAFLVSPWVGGCNGEERQASWRENAHTDMITLEFIRGLETMNFGGTSWEQERAEGKGWALPLDVDPSWFGGLDAVARHVYVTAGQLEPLRDQGIEYATRLSEKTKGSKLEVRLDVLEGQAHEFIVLEAGAGKGGPALAKMNNWARSAFGIQSVV